MGVAWQGSDTKCDGGPSWAGGSRLMVGETEVRLPPLPTSTHPSIMQGGWAPAPEPQPTPPLAFSPHLPSPSAPSISATDGSGSVCTRCDAYPHLTTDLIVLPLLAPPHNQSPSSKVCRQGWSSPGACPSYEHAPPCRGSSRTIPTPSHADASPVDISSSAHR